MRRNSVKLTTVGDIPLALSNVACGNGFDRYATVTDVLDAVEDSVDAHDLFMRLAGLNLLGFDCMTIDRETDTYVRIKGVDKLKNVYLLTARK